MPFELQAAQVLAYYCLTPLVDYLAASLPPDDVRAELSKFDDNLLACVVPAVLPAAIAEDDPEHRPFASPLFWAGFTVTGDGGGTQVTF